MKEQLTQQKMYGSHFEIIVHQDQRFEHSFCVEKNGRISKHSIMRDSYMPRRRDNRGVNIYPVYSGMDLEAKCYIIKKGNHPGGGGWITNENMYFDSLTEAIETVLMDDSFEFEWQKDRKPRPTDYSRSGSSFQLIEHPIDGHITDKKWAEEDIYIEGYCSAEKGSPCDSSLYNGIFRRAYILGYNAYLDYNAYGDYTLEESIVLDLY